MLTHWPLTFYSGCEIQKPVPETATPSLVQIPMAVEPSLSWNNLQSACGSMWPQFPYKMRQLSSAVDFQALKSQQ